MNSLQLQLVHSCTPLPRAVSMKRRWRSALPEKQLHKDSQRADERLQNCSWPARLRLCSEDCVGEPGLLGCEIAEASARVNVKSRLRNRLAHNLALFELPNVGEMQHAASLLRRLV